VYWALDYFLNLSMTDGFLVHSFKLHLTIETYWNKLFSNLYPSSVTLYYILTKFVTLATDAHIDWHNANTTGQYLISARGWQRANIIVYAPPRHPVKYSKCFWLNWWLRNIFALHSHYGYGIYFFVGVDLKIFNSAMVGEYIRRVRIRS